MQVVLKLADAVLHRLAIGRGTMPEEAETKRQRRDPQRRPVMQLPLEEPATQPLISFSAATCLALRFARTVAGMVCRPEDHHSILDG